MATKNQLLQEYLKGRFTPGVSTNLAKDRDFQAYMEEERKRRAAEQAAQPAPVPAPPSLFQQAVRNVKQNVQTARNVVGGLDLVRQDISGVSAGKERVAELQNKVIEARKKAVIESGVLSPETKKQLLDKLTTEQRAAFKTRGEQLKAQETTLGRAQEAIKTPASFGAGVKRSGEGLLQGAGGLYDILTPGKGQSRVTQFATRSAEGTDKLVKDTGMNQFAYKGGQFTGEVLQMLSGAELAKLASKAPAIAKIANATERAAKWEEAVRATAKGNRAAEAALKAVSYVANPQRVANIAANTAVDQGQIAARGQDINAGTVAKSVGLNYALGGVLDIAGAGISRKFPGKSTPVDEVTHITTEANLPSIIKSGKLKQSEAPLGGFEGKKGVFLASGDNPYLHPDQNNIRIVYERGNLGKKITESGDGQLLVKGDVPNKVIKRIEVPTEELAIPLRRRGYEVAVDPTLSPFSQVAPGQKLLEAGSTQRVTTSGPNGAVMGGVEPAQTDLQRLAVVQKKIAQAQQRGGLGADEARALFQERTQLIERIQNPQATSGAIPTPATTNVASAVEPNPTLAGNIPASPRTTGAPGESIPMAAQRLEADALKADLAPEDGFNLTPTANMNMEDQINKAIVLMDNNFDVATKVAMGKTNAPGDLQSSVVFEAVKQRAIKNKDKALLYELSKSDVPSQGKAAGQFIKGFDTKNAEDPVAVMQRVVKARKDSKIPGINKDLTMDEVTTITDMSDDLISKKAAMADTPVGSKERLAYGQARVAYDNYVNELEAAAKKRSIKDRVVQHPADSLNELAGSIKGIQAALDNSAIFRQGWKTMWTNPKMWTKNMLRTFSDIKGGLTNKNMIDALKADIISRPNFELYKKAKLAVSDIAEEAFPSSLPERIPALGRAFKASEYAYTGFLQRQRADVFDKLLDVARAQGRDVTDAKELQAIGNYVNTLTGRANLGKAEPAAKYFNNIFFSPRNFWANVQTLTGNQLQRGVTPFVRQQAALNLLKIIGGTASVLATANFLKPGSVEWDPRSSDFGKIKIGNTRFDASGGMSSLVTIASRLLPTQHRGEWGNFKKSSTTGMMQQYNTGRQGDQTTWDAFLDFGEGKLSPAAQVVKQLMTGEDFTGGKVTPAQAALNAIVPIPIKNFQELQQDPNSANTLIAMIADGLGIGTNTYGSQKDWNQSDSKRVNQFKQSVDETQFIEANARYNERLKTWLENVQKDSAFGKKPITEQQGLINNKRNKLMNEVMKEYGFQYKQDRSNKDENERLMGL